MTHDLYARIPMPWARKGPRFLSPSAHRIDGDDDADLTRTRCGLPVPPSTIRSADHARPLAVCRTCDYMATK